MSSSRGRRPRCLSSSHNPIHPTIGDDDDIVDGLDLLLCATVQSASSPSASGLFARLLCQIFFQDTVTPIANLLRRHPWPVVTYRWDRFEKACSQLFGWKTDAVHTTNEVAGCAATPALDLVANSVTGGNFCGRGGTFNDTAIPSTVALRHRSMRAAIIYEYVVEGKGIRKKARSALTCMW